MRLDVSVVICSRDRPALLMEAVTSVVRGLDTPSELIVVDQSARPHPTLPGSPVLGGVEVRYVHTSSVGVSRSRNLGISLARTDRLAFIDDDVTVAPDWLGAMIGALGTSEARVVVTGRVLENDAQAGRFAPSTKTETQRAVYAGRIWDDVLFTGNMALNRATIAEIGGFDERLGPGATFPAAEDNDLGFRLLEAGYRIIYVPEAVVFHRAWRTSHDYLPLRWRYARGQGAFYAKHGRLRDGHMRRRLARHLGRLARRTVQRARHQHRIAWDQVIPMLGIVTGAAQWLLTQRDTQRDPRLPIGSVRFGSLRRVTPISREFGFERGLPIDRYYIERFLAEQAAAIRGRVLEVGDNSYTRQFGADRVVQSDVLHVTEGSPGATIVADLAHADQIPSDSFDCIILTQTLHLIFDVQAAIQTVHRILKPGGVVLATVPAISQMSIDEWAETWYWSMMRHAARRLFEAEFPPERVSVEAWGNVLTASAFLYGLAASELQPDELAHHDPSYEMLVTVRAEKPRGERE
jgi:GT2 family glycosyltransferase/SAM-dependent methyltransferase